MGRNDHDRKTLSIRSIAAAIVLAALTPAMAQDPGKTKDAARLPARRVEERRTRRCADVEKGDHEGRSGPDESPSDPSKSAQKANEKAVRARTEASLNRHPTGPSRHPGPSRSHPRIRHLTIFWANSARARTSPPRRSVGKSRVLAQAIRRGTRRPKTRAHPGWAATTRRSTPGSRSLRAESVNAKALTTSSEAAPSAT